MQPLPNEDEVNPAEEGPITSLFAGPARTKIVEAFVSNGSRELNVSDVARLSDTARSSVYRHIDELQKLGIVKEVEGGGRYTLDSDDQLAELLRKVEGVTLQRLLEIDESDG